MKQIKNVVFAAFVLAVMLTVGMAAVFVPGQIKEVKVPEGEPTRSYIAENADAISDCTVEGNKAVPVEGGDAQLIFDLSKQGIKTVHVEIEGEQQPIVFYYTSGEDFDATNAVVIQASEDRPIIYDFSNFDLEKLRIDFDNEVTFKKIDFYSSTNITYSEVESNGFDYVIIYAIAIAMTVLFTYIQIKVDFLSTIWEFVKKNYKRIMILIAIVFGAMIVGCATELVFNEIRGCEFKMYRALFIASVYAIISEFVFFFNELGRHVERIFAAVTVTVGVIMIFCAPFGHICWDTESHYLFSLRTTALTTRVTAAEAKLINNDSITFPTETSAENNAHIQTLNDVQEDITSDVYGPRPMISHVLMGLSLKTARFLGADFITSFNVGRLVNLLTYVIVCYYAIKKLRSGRMVMVIIASLPTSLFLATNYAYDAWITAFTLLGFAYFFSTIQGEHRITLTDTIIMCSAFMLGSMPKEVYIPIMLIPFLMPKSKIRNKKQYYSICSAAIVIVALMLLYRAFGSFTSGGDERGGTDVNSMGQLMYILQNPLAYAKTYFKFFFEYVSIRNMQNYITNFAYLGSGKYYYMYVIALIVTVITDKNELDKITSTAKYRTIMIILFMMLSALIITSLYIAFTPVGYNTVNGCQARYLIPLIFPVCYVCGSTQIKNTMKKRVYNSIIYGTLTATLLYNIYTVMITKML